MHILTAGVVKMLEGFDHNLPYGEDEDRTQLIFIVTVRNIMYKNLWMPYLSLAWYNNEQL